MNSLAKECISTFFAGFLFLIVFMANPGFAYIIQENSTLPVSSQSTQVAYFADHSVTPLASSPTSATLLNSQSPTTTNTPSTGFTSTSSTSPTNTCSVSKLSPMESKEIMNLTHDGFDAKKISDGKDQNSPTKDLGPQSVIGKDNDGKKAVKVDAPSVATSADRFSFFNGRVTTGPFGVGLILDDTLRVGRCDLPTSQQALCKIMGQGLSTRTSGVGFTSDMVNAWTSIPSVGKSIAELNLTGTDLNKTKANYLDVNSKDFQTGNFAQGAQLNNSIRTSQYTATNATSCNNSACTISTYSAFDKYFNAWLTTDMVVTNIGPTMLQKANKLFMKAFKTSGQNASTSYLSGVARLREKIVGTPQALLKAATMPASVTLGQARIRRFKTLVIEEGFEDVLGPLYLKKHLFSTGAAGDVSAITKPDSPIWKYTPEKRAKFFEAVEHLTAYTRENATLVNAAKDEYAAAIAATNAIVDPVAKSAAQKAAKISYGQKVSVYMDDWDEILAMDFEDWLKDKEEIASLGGLAVRQAGITRDMEGYVDIATAPPFNLKKITQKFGDEGSWSGWAGSADAGAYKVAPDGVSLELYRIKPEKVVQENVGIGDLKLHVAKLGGSTYSVRLPDGRYLPLNSSTVDYIAGNPQIGGTVNIYESAYVPAGLMTPEDFATRITHQRIVGRPNTALRNMEDIRNALVQNDYGGRKYYSLLDKQFSEEKDMLTAYFKDPATGIFKGTVLPVAYWEGKRGLGNEDFSAYMLPDTWSTTTASQGQDALYKDSFIDFYANEGSDQGDMFKRAFNSVALVWGKIIEMAASTNQFTSDMLTKVSGGFYGTGSGMRDTVGEVAFYTQNENCAGCTVPWKTINNYLQVGEFRAGVNMQAFLLEATNEEAKKTSGSTLIAYTHHSDLSGKTTQIDGGKIDLANAGKNGETCDAILRQYHLGFFGNSAGGILGVTENAAYFFGFGPGLIASFVQQMTIGRALQDCVDDKEGYYIHFYTPPEKQAATSKAAGSVSNETITTALSDMSTKLDSFVKEQATNTAVKAVTDKVSPVPTATPGNPVENSMDKLKDQFQQLTDKAKKSAVLQASIDLLAPSEGTVRGKDVFYVWFKGDAMPIGYKTDGKDVLTDGNKSLEIDYSKGELIYNGKTIVDSNKADHVRMATPSTDAKAVFIPVTLNKIAAPNDDSTVFQLNPTGEVRVLNKSVLNCIQKAVLDQTGITYSGDELTQVLGNLSSIETETYSAFAQNGKIMIGGSGPRAEGASNSKFIINGFWQSKLIIDINNFVDTGKFTGMKFEHGSIVLNTQTNELIVYIRQHKDSILNSSDVKGLNATPTTIVDPETGCTQPAIDLQAVPQLNDELGAKKVSNFNTSMNTLGPFTQFTTPTKTYEFYSKKDGNTGECKNYFRVRDTATGKILTDSEITGGVKVNDDGSISFSTADGKQHTLQFSAENGVPKLTYDGGTPETLLSAQGPNGSFWYDPEKGLWYPENGLQVPLNQSFKDNGAWFSPDKSGNVSGTGTNGMTFNIGQQEAGGFNIPSMPQTTVGIIAFAMMFLIIAFTLTQRKPLVKKRK